MRKLGRIVLALVGTALVAAGAFLIPPHLQIRGVEPPLPSHEALRALLDVGDAPVSFEYLELARQASGQATLGHTAFLARWSDGRSFLIDVGMDRETAQTFAELLQTLLGAGEHRFSGTVPDVLGERVAEIQGVGFTHLHLDHAQGLDAFCAARGSGATLYQTRDQAEKHNFNTTGSAERVARSCLAPGELTGDRLLRAEGFPGLGIVALGGHTPGSTLFAVATGGHLWVVSGDIGNRKSDLLEDVPKSWLYSYVLVPEHTSRTRALRRWLADLDAQPDVTVLVSHDLGDLEASGLPRFDMPRDPVRIRGEAAGAPLSRLIPGIFPI